MTAFPFYPATQPTNVTTSGAVVAIPIAPEWRRAPYDLTVIHKAGDATVTDLKVSTDQTFAGTFKDRLAACIDVSLGVVVDDNGGLGHKWHWEESDGVLYVQILPDAGTNNDYEVRVMARKTV